MSPINPLSPILCLILVACSISSLQGQSVSGQVIDSETKEPIPFVNVYFSDTSHGVVTDMNGKFTLSLKGYERQDIIISYVGYQSETIASYTAGQVYQVYLTPDARMLNEVEVYADTVARAKKVAAFLKEFLGESKNAQECTIENIDDVKLVYLNSGTLKAFCKVPLKITNKALGYQITYYLSEFTKAPDHTIFYGTSIFREDTVNISEREKKHISKARTSTYNGSTTHFLRVLWKGDIPQSKFKCLNPKTGRAEQLDEAIRIVDADVKSIGPRQITISYKGELTGWFITDQKGVEFTKAGYTAPFGQSWSGAMSKQRMADQLPLDFEAAE